MCGGTNFCFLRRSSVSFLLILRELKSMSFEGASFHYAARNVKSVGAPPIEVRIQSHLARLALNSVQRLWCKIQKWAVSRDWNDLLPFPLAEGHKLSRVSGNLWCPSGIIKLWLPACWEWPLSWGCGKLHQQPLKWWREPAMMGKAGCLDHLQVSALGTRGCCAAGNCSSNCWEKSCRAGTVQLATQLLSCFARYFRASLCSGTTLEVDLMKLLVPDWAVK